MKSKAVLALFGFAAASALALPAMAQTSDGAFYLGGSLGSATSRKFCDGLGSTCIDDKRETLRGLFGYQFNRYFAVEAGYHVLGTARDDDPAVMKSAEANASEIVGIVSIPVFKEISVYGKAGAYHGKIKGSLTGSSFKASNNDVTVGLGVRWDFFAPVSLRAELQSYQRMGTEATGSRTDIYVWSVGAIYTFK